MKAAYINYSDTHSFSPAVISYLNGDPLLDPFISHKPNPEGFEAILNTRKVTANRSLLVEVLTQQYAELRALKPAIRVTKNIQLLADENTYTITTGHQLNIFTGPLYFIYKIVTAINLSNQLKATFPDKNFIPVYWMATEDHDFEEINHTSLFGKKIKWNTGASGATGRIDTASMAAVLKEYEGALGISENAANLSSIIKEAYTQRNTLSGATRYMVDALFAEYGLVILDADDKRLKQQFAPIIEKDIFEQNSYRQINNSTSQLQQLGINTQVNAREINFFYLKDNLRERITFEGGLYYVLNSDIKFTPDELKNEIYDHPDRFSPNVVLRPLYQEVILPNIAYVGGGAEVVYWLQLKQNFNFYTIDFPILVLRNSALIADETIEIKLRRLELQFKDLFRETDELKKDWILNHTKHDLKLADEWQELQCIFEKIKLRAYKIDSTLSASTEAVKARLHKQLQNLEKKLVKAEKRNYLTALTQIDNIKEKLFPNHGLQERSENFGSFYIKYGDDFIAQLIRNFRPLDFKFTILCC